jgi:1-aminocyclopropane-1-carboxylate deaminase/D-cysteine desulfhydrase-like pyridoxal-dependent ACC family enzyme
MEWELALPRIVPRSSEEYEQSGNVLLDRLLGARLRELPAEQNSSSVLDRVAEELRAGGRKPYVIPPGGSTANGALGYVQAALRAARSGPRG